MPSFPQKCRSPLGRHHLVRVKAWRFRAKPDILELFSIKFRRRAEKADIGVMLTVDGGYWEGDAISTAQILVMGRTLVTLVNQLGCESCSSHFVD